MNNGLNGFKFGEFHNLVTDSVVEVLGSKNEGVCIHDVFFKMKEKTPKPIRSADVSGRIKRLLDTGFLIELSHKYTCKYCDRSHRFFKLNKKPGTYTPTPKERLLTQQREQIIKEHEALHPRKPEVTAKIIVKKVCSNCGATLEE